MKTKSYFPKLLPEKNGKSIHSLPVVYTTQLEEGDEGGLDLGQLFGALRRRGMIVAGITTAIASAAFAFAFSSTPTYQAKFELLITPETVENKLTPSLLKEEVDRHSGGVNETQLKILQSPRIMLPIVNDIEARYPNHGVPKLKFNLVTGTNVLEVSYQDPNPEKVSLVLDIVSQAYVAYSLEERQADVRQGIQFVEQQLPQLQQQVESLQEQIQTFRQQYNLIDPANQGKQLADQLHGIVQQRLETQTQLAKFQSLHSTLQNQLQLQPEEAKTASALSEAPRYQKLLNQLQELESQIAVESAKYHDDSPQIQVLRDQKQNLLPLIEQEGQRVLLNTAPNDVFESKTLASPNSLRQQQTQQFFDTANQIQALKAQSLALTQAEQSLRQQFQRFPVLVRQNDDLERQLKIAVDNLNQFLTKREALRIDAAQKQSPWQLLTPPTEPKSSTVSVKQVLILGTGLGLILGIAAALLVDKLKNVFYTSDEVKAIANLPLLGEIPIQRYNEAYQESLHSLYTNIRFLSFDTPVRSLSIISPTSGDGRSTIAVHLAQTIAAMGQRVLLVDADLRRPKIHMLLGLPNTKGLSNVITEELNFQDVIQRSSNVLTTFEGYGSADAQLRTVKPPLEDDFFVLTSGQVPPNPISLLTSQKMQILAKDFYSAFDFVIYDTPPLLKFADSSIVAAQTDTSILVVGLAKTKSSALEKALDRLKLSNCSVLGTIINLTKK